MLYPHIVDSIDCENWLHVDLFEFKNFLLKAIEIRDTFH